MHQSFDAVFLSDLHLGSRTSRTDIILKFFKMFTTEKLFLVGDVFDLWRLKVSHYWTNETTKVVQKFLKLAKNGTEIYYITGNHDHGIRDFTPFSLHNIHFVDEYFLDDKIWIIHGDQVDRFVCRFPYISRLSGFLHDLIKSKSFFKKINFRRGVSFENEFISSLVELCKERNIDKIICGHTHIPSIREVDGIIYMNCGDWVSNCSFLGLQGNRMGLYVWNEESQSFLEKESISIL